MIELLLKTTRCVRSDSVHRRICSSLQTVYGDEVKFGGGKSIREGMGQATDRSCDECIETVITNALIVDWTGIFKVHYSH